MTIDELNEKYLKTTQGEWESGTGREARKVWIEPSGLMIALTSNSDSDGNSAFIADIHNEWPQIYAKMKHRSDEVAELVTLLEKLIKDAPTRKPERYEGSNHGDTEQNAQEIAAWHTAEMIRPILSEHLSSKGSGE